VFSDYIEKGSTGVSEAVGYCLVAASVPYGKRSEDCHFRGEVITVLAFIQAAWM